MCLSTVITERLIIVCVCLFIDLEWQIIYVGSASDDTCDQTLDSVLVGPVQQGRHRFVFEVSLLNTVLSAMIFIF